MYSSDRANAAGRRDPNVVIVGGGPAGLVLLISLTAHLPYTSSASNNTLRSSVKVTLVEGGDLSKIYDWNLPPDAFSNRVVSLTNATLDFLEGVSLLLF